MRNIYPWQLWHSEGHETNFDELKNIHWLLLECIFEYKSYLYIFFINIIDPSLMVLVNPITQRALDVTPYNKFSILCNASSPQEIFTSKAVIWTQESPDGVSQTVFHNGLSTNITYYNLSNASSASTLSTYGLSMGIWSYMCRFSLQIPGDPPVRYSESAEVVVKGQLIIRLVI